MASNSSTNKRLVRQLKGMLKDVPVEVLGHVESTFACCDNGTVALVKIDKGRPASRPAAKSRKK
jgi:hypothetical protein